jgi:hypothetical protein
MSKKFVWQPYDRVFKKTQEKYNVQQQKFTNQTENKLTKISETREKPRNKINQHFIKRHLGYHRHCDESPQTKTDGVYVYANSGTTTISS